MRAVVVTAPGTDPVAAEFPEPEPTEHEQVHELVAAGVHWVARALAAGLHYGSQDQYPLVPGVDAVARTSDGRLVYTGWARAPWGTMAERLATPATIDLPAGADPLAIAAGVNPGMSGWLPLVTRREEQGRLGTVLVLGATGMSGRMAALSARHLGAEAVIGAGRDPERLEHLRALGLEAVALGDDPAAALTTTLDGRTPDLVLDDVWGPVAEAAFAALGRRGLDEDTGDITYTQIGSLAGPTAALPAALLRSRRIRVVGSGSGSASTATILRELPKVMALIADGTLEAPYAAYPIDRVAQAWADTDNGRRAVVTP